MRRLFVMLGVLLLAACQPMGPIPGGALKGTVQPPPADWTAANSEQTVQLETRPDRPYSVNIWGVGIGAGFYVAAGAGETAWSKNIDANPQVRLRIGESIYELKATRVADAAELTQVRAAYETKYKMSDDQREHAAKAAVFRLDRR